MAQVSVPSPSLIQFWTICVMVSLRAVIFFFVAVVALSQEQCPGRHCDLEGDELLLEEVEHERLLAERQQQREGAMGLLQVKTNLSGHYEDYEAAVSSEVESRGRSRASKASHSEQDQKSTEGRNGTEPGMMGALIAPFGKEDTARELQHHAARTQDTLVDAIENAEVAEIKRSIFRSLTRLRAAEIKEFDTIARLETQAIDEYNDNHHYRAENPLDYIHAAESTVKEDKYTSFHD
mmetsp:Transcript_24781/g.45502  ORF Transcript_24781/g.45502 Transcript_24781/m.45502 type:complete len:236 (+) Transcript_24781:23-730(+)